MTHKKTSSSHKRLSHQRCASSALALWVLTSHFFQLFVPRFFSGLWFISEVKWKSALRGPSVCSMVDGGGLISHTGVRVCALTAHQWTIRPWLLMSCYLASCRVTICSRCWRQTSNLWCWRGGISSWEAKGSGLAEKWMGPNRDTHNHTLTTCSQLLLL